MYSWDQGKTERTRLVKCVLNIATDASLPTLISDENRDEVHYSNGKSPNATKASENGLEFVGGERRSHGIWVFVQQQRQTARIARPSERGEWLTSRLETDYDLSSISERASD